MKHFVLPRKHFTKADQYKFIEDGHIFTGFLYKGIVLVAKCSLDGTVYLSIETYQIFDDVRKAHDAYASITHDEFELGVSYEYAKEHLDEFIHDCELVYNMVVPSGG